MITLFLFAALVVGPMLLVLACSADHADTHAGDVAYQRNCRATFGTHNVAADTARGVPLGDQRPSSVPVLSGHGRPASSNSFSVTRPTDGQSFGLTTAIDTRSRSTRLHRDHP